MWCAPQAGAIGKGVWRWKRAGRAQAERWPRRLLAAIPVRGVVTDQTLSWSGSAPARTLRLLPEPFRNRDQTDERSV